MGSPQGCVHVEPDRIHGEEFVGQRGNGKTRLQGKPIGTEKGGVMNKDRLEWIMSGLNQYALTKDEDKFVKSAVEHFGQHRLLTTQQEERIETLYKEKSKYIPNKKSANYFSFAETIPKKARPRRPRAKVF